MKKGGVYSGKVERVEFPDKGIVDTGEGLAAVKNVIPGQQVLISAGKKQGGMVKGRLIKVLEPSPLETAEHVCEHFGRCGGCAYQSVPYKEQLCLKESMLKELLLPYVPEECFMPIKASPRKTGYKNKMEFSFGNAEKDGPLELGLHARGSFYDIISVNGCQIAHPDMDAVRRCVLDVCREYGLTFYHKQSHKGYLRHLLVRRGENTGEIMAALVTTSQTEGLFSDGEDAFLADLTKRLAALEYSGVLAGFLHMSNDAVSDTVKSDRTTLLYGRDYIYEELSGLRFKITPFSFFQTNTLGAGVLYETVRGLAGRCEGTVYDLYCGTGTIAQVMAGAARQVVGVEIVAEAAAAAAENARENGLANCRFITGDVLAVLDELSDKPDLIILDPPRDGVHPKALPKIIARGVERVIYISCKPTSLARDLPAFLAAGYSAERVVPVDMFPGTYHVETVCLLKQT